MTGPRSTQSTVATIGVFDGVHRGHQELIRRAGRHAIRRGCRTTAVTFDPHPMAVLAPDCAPGMLMSIGRRRSALLAAGADDVVVLPFSSAMARWVPERFVNEVLVRHAVAHVVVGADFRFGANASGDATILEELGRRYGFGVSTVGLVRSAGERVSSTGIRQHLARGDVAAVAHALGRPHVVEGRMDVHGDVATVGDIEGLLPCAGQYRAAITTGDDASAALATVGQGVVTLDASNDSCGRLQRFAPDSRRPPTEHVTVRFDRPAGPPLEIRKNRPSRGHTCAAGETRDAMSAGQMTGMSS